jgi:ATP-binding cassette subfamily B (MDR/TAP) protein 10
MSEIREAARLANCDFIEDLPQGFDTPVGAKAAQISGGQRQRLAIARALVRQPAILILDEATSALDAASETLVNQAVKRITSTNSLTTILIAHRLSTLKTADEIVFMEDGKVAERGTYEELAREGSRFWTMVRSQMLGTATGTTTGPASESNNKEEEKEAMQP